MTLPALLEDALAADDRGFTLRLSLPWIRSLPISSLRELSLAVDGQSIASLSAAIGDRRVPVTRLSDESGWWFLQDRIVLESTRAVRPGEHHVAISFRLVIPNLRLGPDGPLELPFAFERDLTPTTASDPRSVTRDVA